MNIRVLAFWESLRSSYWFIPISMFMGAIALASLAPFLDQIIPAEWIQEARWVYSGGPEGARAVLSTIGGSMITVAGVVFSITIVALSLASSQFGPRLIQNFMKNRTYQVVLGTFTSTFVYCLIILKTISQEQDYSFVPQLSVTFSVVLAIISLALLIYFIHDVAASIQVNRVISDVSREFEEVIERLFPISGFPQWSPVEPHFDTAPSELELIAAQGGYVQAIDMAALLRKANEEDLTLELRTHQGDFLNRGSPIAAVLGRRELDEETAEELCKAFILGSVRTATQDLRFALDRLVEVAIRALSPGINDPYTAINCLDRIGAGLALLAERKTKFAGICDAEGRLRLITIPFTFAEAADIGFNQIRFYGKSNLMVNLHLLKTMGKLGRSARTPSQQEVLIRHLDRVLRASQEGLPEEEDWAQVRDCHQQTAQILRGYASPC